MSFLRDIINGVKEEKNRLAAVAALESEHSVEAITGELGKAALLPERWNFILNSPNFGSGGGKVVTMRPEPCQIKPEFYSTMIYAVIYELAKNKSAVIFLVSQESPLFVSAFAEIVKQAAKKSNLPRGIFQLIYGNKSFCRIGGWPDVDISYRVGNKAVNVVIPDY